MKILSINSYLQTFELTRPYTIAYKTQTSVENVIVEITTDKGQIGFGAASPAPEVTGETMASCLQSLRSENVAWLQMRNLHDFEHLKLENVYKLSHTPAACAAIDIALHDLYAQMHHQPLVDVLGRVHHQIPTSITIGIKNVAETLFEAAEYISRGFSVLKVKLGCNLEEDIERLIKLREQYSNKIKIRVDPNQGYTFVDFIDFIDKTKHLDIEFYEQPIKASATNELCNLSDDDKKLIALDESILNADDALRVLAGPSLCGIFNIKLMKCGGIFSAQKIAYIAQNAKIDLMWGCMDESIISIAAALHVAFSSPATRYIDLDGSLDLADDVVMGGFCLQDGNMSVLDLPGLGVERIS